MRCGMEILQRVHLFAGADQLDRLAGDGAHRQRRAAAAVAVDAGQHDAGDADAVVEILGEIDGVLAGEASATSRISCGLGGGLDLRHLGHQRLVDMGAAGGVEHHDVVALQARGLLGAAGDLHRRLAGDDRQRVDADLPAEHGELFLRRRALHVERGHQHRASWRSVRRLAILAVVVVLPAPCRPTIMMATGGGGVEVDRLGVRAQRLDQDVVDDLDDHLAGRDRFDDIGADGAVA